MTDMEAVMWAVEKDPALRSDFTNLTILDRVPSQARLEEMVERIIAGMPRLGQRVRSTPMRLAPPRWEDDPQINVEYHLRRVAIPPPGTMRALLDAAAQLAATPFDRSRPLWEFTLFEGLANGKAALLQKMHHTITDGVGGLKLSVAMIDFERNPKRKINITSEIASERRAAHIANPIPETSMLNEMWSGLTAAVSTQARRTRSVVAAGGAMVAHPEHLPAVGRSVWNVLNSVQRQVISGPHGHSKLFRPRSLGRRYDVFSVPFDSVHQTAKAEGVTVNDVFVCAITRGISSYHAVFGEHPNSLRMAMPINLRKRPGQHGANAFAPVRVLVPTSEGSARDHLHAVSNALHSVAHEPILEVMGSLSGAVNFLPTSALVAFTRQQTQAIDFATSNLRGAPSHLYMAGSRIEHTFPLGPRANAPLNVTVMSYAGMLEHGVHSDPIAVADPEALVAFMQSAWEEVLALAPSRKAKRTASRSSTSS